MAMYEPTFLPPNAEEQDFIQAYENVREKYKGERASASHRCRALYWNMAGGHDTWE